MSGKDAKRELRRQKEAARVAARRTQPPQSIFTGHVIGSLCGIGGVLIVISARPDADELAAAAAASELAAASEGASELPTDAPTPAGSEAPDERPVACGAEAPANAGQPAPPVTEPEQMLEEGADYRAVIETSCGRLAVDLLEDEAPQTVNNFVALAEQGFFDGREIFRNATSIGALQTGSGTDDASFDLGYTIPDELAAAEADGYPPGTLAMANTGQPDSGGSQFFFVYNDRFQLDPTYAVFGRTNARGVAVLEQIGAIPTQAPDDPGNEVPSERVFIESVEIRTG